MVLYMLFVLVLVKEVWSVNEVIADRWHLLSSSGGLYICVIMLSRWTPHLNSAYFTSHYVAD